jgi:spermidine synthase
MLKKLLSYIIPIRILKQKSSISESLEITWANGELVLDSKNTNYSYGSLQRILRKGLKSIGFEKINTMNHILVLGVAGGSVVKTLINDVGFKGKITGVEIDTEIINVANTYFKLDKIPNLEIYIEDAFEFVLKTKNKYDLIIIDVFQDTKMPNFLFERFFTDRLDMILSNYGIILFNTMIVEQIQNKRNLNYIAGFNAKKYTVRTIPRVERHNELIIIEKLN